VVERYKEKEKNNFPNAFFLMIGFIGLTLRKSPFFEEKER
jgi:hypothetical protein